jgi:ABC-2 type transport system permease protein
MKSLLTWSERTMWKILKIAQREYVDTVKTKTFLISLLFAPAITVGIIFFANKVSRSEGGPRPPVKVAVTDLSAELSGQIESGFEKHNDSHPNRQILFQALEDNQSRESVQEQGKAGVRSGKIDAYVVIDQDILEGPGKVYFYTHKPKPTNLDAFWAVEEIINSTVIDRRCRLRNLSPELLTELRSVPIERLEIGSGQDEQRLQSQAERITRMMIPFFFMFLIYMGIIGIGQQMLSSVIEEKNSRIIEVLLSAVTPFQLMTGKILGLAGIGLTVTSLWAATAYGAALWQGLEIEITGGLLLYFLLYYVLGFLLFSSILAGVGSVCNTLKETQSLMMPIVLVFMVPIMSWHKLVQSPDGLLARVLSFIPPVTPLVMILRISAGSGVWVLEILASIVLLIATVLVTMWLAAKIFRTGILMYGKRPSAREIFRWLRQS